MTATDPSAIVPETGPTRRDTTQVRGEALVAQVKSLLHEGRSMKVLERGRGQVVDAGVA